MLKALVINLDSSSDRMSRMHTMLSDLGISYQRVPAVDARDWDRERINSFVSDDCTMPPNGGEIGCFLSHRRCWEIVSEGDDEVMLIFEDDAVPSREAGAVLQAFSQMQDIDADVIYLEERSGKVWLGPGRFPLADSYTVGPLRTDVVGCAAYLITKVGAQKLLQESLQYVEPVDLLIYFNLRYSMRISALRPGIFCQEMLLDPHLARARSTIGHPDSIPETKTTLTSLKTRLLRTIDKIVRRSRGEKRFRTDLSMFETSAPAE